MKYFCEVLNPHDGDCACESRGRGYDVYFRNLVILKQGVKEAEMIHL